MSESPSSLVSHFTVLDKQTVSSDYSLVTLEKPASYVYKAGQCINVGLADMADDEARMFSIASSPKEDVIILLVKHGISEYKKRLITVKPGDKLLVGEPTGGFEFNNELPAMMIAGGMGIAPFRSIVKYLVDSKYEQRILLIHLHPTNQSPFAEEFIGWQRQFKSFQFNALTANNKRLDLQELLRQQQTDFGLANPVYYLAGPSDMVISCRQALEEIGIDPELVRADSQLATVASGR